MVGEIEEEFTAYGHRNIRALHKSTLEITKEDSVTPRGDCIVAVKAEKACVDLSDELRKAIIKDGSRVIIEIECGGVKETINARGSAKLTLKSNKSIVIRKSNYICDRTLAVMANKSAGDLSRRLISNLRKGLVVRVRIRVEKRCYS